MNGCDVLRADDPLVAVEAEQDGDLVEVTLPAEGAPEAEINRILTEECGQSQDPAGEQIRPITVVYDSYGLGIYVSTALLAFATVNGPQFNGPGQQRVEVVDREAFAKAIGQQLVRELEDGSTAVTNMLDKAILAAVESGCDGVELKDALTEEEIAQHQAFLEAQRAEVREAGFAYPEDAEAAPASI